MQHDQQLPVLFDQGPYNFILFQIACIFIKLNANTSSLNFSLITMDSDVKFCFSSCDNMSLILGYWIEEVILTKDIVLLRDYLLIVFDRHESILNDMYLLRLLVQLTSLNFGNQILLRSTFHTIFTIPRSLFGLHNLSEFLALW